MKNEKSERLAEYIIDAVFVAGVVAFLGGVAWLSFPAGVALGGLILAAAAARAHGARNDRR